MSLHDNIFLYGIVPPDKEYQAKSEVYWACKKAKVKLPSEIEEFFDGTPPDPKGQVVDLDKHEAGRYWNDGDQDGIELDMSKLPKNVKFLRIVYAY